MGKVKILSNATLFEKLQLADPIFKSETAKGTAEMFTDKGFEALKNSANRTILDKMFQKSLTFYLQAIDVAKAVDTLEAQGFGEKFEVPYGGYIQRMSIGYVKPVTPGYKDIYNTTMEGLNPYITRETPTQERFFELNFDYQSFITIPDEFQFKRIFVDEYGIASFISGLIQALETGYTVQKYVNKLECLNTIINGANYPLQATQKLEMSMDYSAENLESFIEDLNNIVSTMKLLPITSKFNAYGFETKVPVEKLKLLVRPQLVNAIKTKVLAKVFDGNKMSIPLDIVEVPHFGGLTVWAYPENIELKPKFDKNGSVTGYESVDGSITNIDIKDNNRYYTKDPNENVFAMVADSDIIFEGARTNYQVDTIINPRGKYTNYWASAANNIIAYDPIKTCVIYNKI